MAATGKTPILLYGSTTATNVPVAGNLTNSSDGCEIAINVADKNLFFKDSTNAVNTVPIRQSSGSSDGWLSSTDWSTFNSKQPAGTYVTSVTGTAPVVSSGGTTPAISMAAANGTTNGYLTSTDWTTFNSKQPAGSYALTTGTLAQFASTTSAQLAGVISDETGSGSLVFATSPSLTTPNIGAATGTSLTATGVIKAGYATGFYVDNSGTMLGRLYYSGGLLLDRAAGTNFYVLENGSGQFRVDATTGNVNVSVGNLVIGTSGKGIDFSATAGTGTSELFADYEEGTFTPAIYGTTTAGTGTYSNQVGRYTKIGNRVTYNIYLNWSAHTGTGNMRVSGLPYTTNSTTGNFTAPSLWQNAISLTAGNVLQAFVSAGVTYIIFYQYATGGGGTSAVPLDTAGEIAISGVYEV